MATQDAIKCYFTEVHGVAAMALLYFCATLSDCYMDYMEGFYGMVDSSKDGHFSKTTLR